MICLTEKQLVCYSAQAISCSSMTHTHIPNQLLVTAVYLYLEQMILLTPNNVVAQA